jgi:predicted XRE-type DNA-binding protein
MDGTEEPLDVFRGSGNVFSDTGCPSPEALQLKAILATAVFSLMDRDGLTAREAQRLTGVDAADFSRIRNADFRRLSIERLMTINARLGSRIEVDVRVKPRPARPSRMNDDASSIALWMVASKVPAVP